jgi:acyl-CoA thioesterase FadM
MKASHFWLGQAVDYGSTRDSWIMERRRRLARRAHGQRPRIPPFDRTKVLNEALAGCSRLAVKPVATSLERGEEPAPITPAARVFSLVAEKAGKGDFYGFVRNLIAAGRATHTVNSDQWLAALDATAGSRTLSPQSASLIEKGSAKPADDIAALLKSAGIPYKVDAKGVPSAVRPIFEMKLLAEPQHIDELGHVNNAVWVQWMEMVAVAHWRSVADPNHQDDYVWVVVRHEIDYLRAALEGETITARTWVGEAQGRTLRPAHGVCRRGREDPRPLAHRLGDHRQGERAADPHPDGGRQAVS